MIHKKQGLLISIIAILLFANVKNVNGELIDSAKIYLAKDWPLQKKVHRAYAYCLNNLDENADYGLKVGKKLFQLAKDSGDSLSLAKIYYLIGYAYSNKENFVLAIDYLFKTLQLSEPLKNNVLISNSYNVIGICYSKQNQHEKAAEYFKKVIAQAEKFKDEQKMGVSFNNLAIELQHLKQYSQADLYLKKSYAIFKKLEVNQYLSFIVMNRGVIRFEKGMYDSALVYYRDANVLSANYNKEHLPPSISNNMGELFYKLQEYDSSLYYLNHSLTTVDTLNDKYSTRELFKHLSNTYNAKANIGMAFYYLRKHNQVNDYIFNDENLKRTVASEANFNYIKKENELKLSEEKRIFEKKRTTIFNIFGSITGILLIIALIITIFRFREKKKANAILVKQKSQIEHQAKEITDSINYAKRIQDSILPTSDTMQKVLSDHILIYMPRDIVGGDFYFVEEVDNKKYFAVIDCTGHGVPGGFMSILGYNGLQNAILDLKLRHPNEILDSLSKNLVTHFTQEGKETLRDGMDMAICCMYEKNGKTILEFAGANNPCWILKKKSVSSSEFLVEHDKKSKGVGMNEIDHKSKFTADNKSGHTPKTHAHTNSKLETRNNLDENQSSELELIELKANKQPIGYFENFKPFTNHIMELEKGDMIYLFSDGYADQFGGLSGKKFKYSQLKSLIIHTPLLSIKEKENALKQSFLDWKGNFEQLDDVCVLGVRV